MELNAEDGGSRRFIMVSSTEATEDDPDKKSVPRRDGGAQAKGGEDPVKRVRDKLVEIGVDDTAIATHTSGEPDPDFHSLA